MKIIWFVIRYALLGFAVYKAWEVYPVYFTVHNSLYFIKIVLLLFITGFSLWVFASTLTSFLPRKKKKAPVNPRLKIRGNDRKEGLFLLDKMACLIGNSQTCDITITGSGISKKHCMVYKKDGDFFIRDDWSGEKTFLNDAVVDEHKLLKHGDVITLGAKKAESKTLIEFLLT